MKKFIYAFIIVMLVSVIGCSGNTRAKYYGGTTKIELKQDERLVNITWKEDSLWLHVVNDATIKPTTHKFQEYST